MGCRSRRSECCPAWLPPPPGPRGRAECRQPQTQWPWADARARPLSRQTDSDTRPGAINSSDDGSCSPATFWPSRSVVTIMSGVMRHEPFGDAFRRRQQMIVSKPGVDVPVVRCSVGPSVHAVPLFDDIGPEPSLVLHAGLRARPEHPAAVLRAEVVHRGPRLRRERTRRIDVRPAHRVPHQRYTLAGRRLWRFRGSREETGDEIPDPAHHKHGDEEPDEPA